MLTPDTDIGINRRIFHQTIIFLRIIIVSFELWDKKTIFDQKSYNIRAKEITFHNRPNCEKPWVEGKVQSTEVGRKFKVEVDLKLIKIKRAFTGLFEE